MNYFIAGSATGGNKRGKIASAVGRDGIGAGNMDVLPPVTVRNKRKKSHVASQMSTAKALLNVTL